VFEKFSVMQYNILGKIYGDPQWFPLHGEKFVLDWNVRSQKLAEKIIEFQPDIVCLEELDEYDFFKNNLGSNGYDSHFQKRPSKEDGCGIFFLKETNLT